LLKKVLIYSFLIYTIFGFFILPQILKPQVIQNVQKQIDAKVTLESIDFNPFIFKLSINNIKLYSLSDKELISLKAIVLDLDILSLIDSTIKIEKFLLDTPKITLILDKKREINLASIIKTSSDSNKKTDESSSEFEMPRVVIQSAAIVNGGIDYKDFSKKSEFYFSLNNIAFELNNLDTKNIKTDGAKVKFFMKLEDGGSLEFRSEILDLEPFIVKGDIKFQASQLYTEWKYLKDSLNLEIADGKISLKTNYYLNIDKLESFELSDLYVDIDKLRVKPKNGTKNVLTLSSFSIKDTTIKPIIQDIHISKITLDNLYLVAQRDKNGLIDWQDFTKTTPVYDAIEEKVEEKKAKDNIPWIVVADDVALKNIKVDFIDKGIRPTVTTKLNELNIYAQNITLDGKKPLKYQLNLLLNDSMRCNFDGSLIHSNLDLSLAAKCRDLNVIDFLPYIDKAARSELKIYNLKLRSLIAGFDTNLTLKDIDSDIVVDISDANFKLSKFAINKKSTNRRVASFSEFNLNGIKLNTKSKKIFIGSTDLKNLNIKTKKLKNGDLNLDKLIVAKTTTPHAKSKQKTKKEKPYSIHVKKAALKSAKVTFEDKTITPSTKNEIDRINLNLYNIDIMKNSWLKYTLFARVNKKGKIRAKGDLRHTPLKQKGSLEIKNISLKDLNPYIKEKAFVKIDDGYISLKCKTKYSKNKDKPDLDMVGSFRVDEFFVNNTKDNSSLISFNKIDLKKFTLELMPNRLYVDEVDVDSFYVHAIVDKNKILNFATLVKKDDKPDIKDKEQSKDSKEEPFPINVMKINVSNGSAIFSDLSLPIKFKTNVHNLNGKIYAISSMPDEASYIDLEGEVDKYGSTKLKGSLITKDPSEYLNIELSFRNLDLSSMSGYSSTFAGYKIDDGKLFLDLNYDILNSKLNAKNSIMIKHIKLGEEIKTEDGSSLPLGFVIALLEDSDGVIDIDMPIEGDVDDPDFKYGALVWKTFANLMLKAVTSPFSFLGSIMGISGDDLESAEFEIGETKIIPSEREKLDNIAKLLTKREKISLSISGGYSLEFDKKAIQKQKLIDLIVKESSAKNREEGINAMSVDLLEDIYDDIRDDNVAEEEKERLEKKYKDENIFEREYIKVLVKLCSESFEVKEQEVQELANKRAKAISDYLINIKKIDKTRVKIVEISEVEIINNDYIPTKLGVFSK
jgi:uncharacterized protein involved in outer membrane biogenesis